MKWTQQQAVAFESARECITALMSILTARLASEEAQHGSGTAAAAALNDRISELFRERAALQPTADEAVARVRQQYGAEVRLAMAAERQRHPELLVA